MSKNPTTEVLIREQIDIKEFMILMEKHGLKTIRGYSSGPGCVIEVDSDQDRVESILIETLIKWEFV